MCLNQALKYPYLIVPRGHITKKEKLTLGNPPKKSWHLSGKI